MENVQHLEQAATAPSHLHSPKSPRSFGKHTLQTHSLALSSLLPAWIPLNTSTDGKSGSQHVLLNLYMAQVTGGAPKRLRIVGVFSLNRAKKKR